MDFRVSGRGGSAVGTVAEVPACAPGIAGVYDLVSSPGPGLLFFFNKGLTETKGSGIMIGFGLGGASMGFG